MCEVSEAARAPLQALADELHDMMAAHWPREHVEPYFCDCQFGAKVYFADLDLRHACCVRLPLRPGTERGAMESVRDGMLDWGAAQAIKLQRQSIT